MTLLDDPNQTESIEGLAITASGLDRSGPTLVPVDRYISPQWAAIETEKVWPHAWQIACSVDHVAEPGDFYEYRCGWLSILIVRGDDGELRAFQNACRHRGNAICEGTGSGLVGAALPVPPVGVDHRGPPQPGAQPQGLRRHRQRRVRPAAGPGRHLRPHRVREPRHGRHGPRRVARGHPRRPLVGADGRLPLPGAGDLADAGQLEGRRRGLLRDVPHPGNPPRDVGPHRRRRRPPEAVAPPRRLVPELRRALAPPRAQRPERDGVGHVDEQHGPAPRRRARHADAGDPRGPDRAGRHRPGPGGALRGEGRRHLDVRQRPAHRHVAVQPVPERHRAGDARHVSRCCRRGPASRPTSASS